MSATFRSSVFACFYLAVLLFVATGCFFLPEMPLWGAVVLTAFGLLGFPFAIARVEINDEGIFQHVFIRHSVAKWADVISWQRVSHPDSDGPDTITVTTRTGSFALYHNCIYGKRLDFVELELRRRIAQPTGCTERRDRVSVDNQTPLARRR